MIPSHSSPEELRDELNSLRALLHVSPDAVLVVDPTGIIREANAQAMRLFGYGIEEMVGRPVEMLVPEGLRERQESHRADDESDPKARPMGTGLDIRARRKDGSGHAVDIALGPITTRWGSSVAVFVRDATGRKQAEDAAHVLREIDLRRQQALEINDNVVQGLATIAYALDAGQIDLAVEATQRTLASARHLMGDLLGNGTAQPLEAGDLVRAQGIEGVMSGPAPAESPDVRIVLADDSEDMRMLLRVALTRYKSISVLAEARDGAEAVDLVAAHRPDVVLLDLAMPVMDGLEALPLIRSRSPETKVIVLSGFDAERMRKMALEQGADAYLEKGSGLSTLKRVIEEVCGRRAS